MNILSLTKIGIVALLVFLPISTNIWAAENKVEQPKACFYTGVDFSGNEICSPLDILPDIGGYTGKFLSVKLIGTAKVKLCSEPNFLGTCTTFNENTAQFGAALLNSVSSIQVFNRKLYEHFVCIYTEESFGGYSLCRPIGFGAELIGVFEKHVNSIRIFGQARLKICTDEKLSGLCGTIVGSRKKISRRLKNKTMSFKILTAKKTDSSPVIKEEPLENKHTLLFDQSIDLDDGKIADLKFGKLKNGILVLMPLNGVTKTRALSKFAGKDGCKALRNSQEASSLISIKPGKFMCIFTSEGKTAQLKFESVNDKEIAFAYSVYD